MAVETSLVWPDVVFLPTALFSIPGPFAPVVTTILDTMPHRLPPGMIARRSGLRARVLTRINAKLASRIITISSWSKNDIVETCGVPAEKISVTYLGYDKSLYNDLPPNPQGSSALLERFGIRKPFVLHHGMVQLRKNLLRLIQAWNQLAESKATAGAQLVLAGPPGYGYEEILRAAGASPSIALTGALSQPDLAALVKNAFLCVIPSLYEGFCLPMVEAMACGVPTIASNASCIPEVSGGVLEYFDPLSVEEMAEAIRRALGDTDLQARLRRDGLARAEEFSWERCARETLSVFSEVAFEHRGNHRAARPPKATANPEATPNQSA